jgi:hypothetical protein
MGGFVTELHVHDWTPWGPSPLSDAAGVLRRQRSCRGCGVWQDKPTPDEAFGPVPDSAIEAAARALTPEADGADWDEVLDEADREAYRISAGIALAAAVPHIERAIRDRIADEIEADFRDKVNDVAISDDEDDWRMPVDQFQDRAPDEPAEAATASCDHHWISTHQPDFPAPIYWVDRCSQCGAYDGAAFANQLRGTREQPPDPALGRCQSLLQCHRETGHPGGHEIDPGPAGRAPDFDQFKVDELAASMRSARAANPELDRACREAESNE